MDLRKLSIVEETRHVHFLHECGKMKTAVIFISLRMEVTVVSYSQSIGVKLHFYSLGAVIHRKRQVYRGIQFLMDTQFPEAAKQADFLGLKGHKSKGFAMRKIRLFGYSWHWEFTAKQKIFCANGGGYGI